MKIFAWKPDDYYFIRSKEFQSLVRNYQNSFKKDIRTIVDDEIKKWKENLNVAFDDEENFKFKNKQHLDIFSIFLQLLDFDSLNLSINFDSLNNFDDVKNKLDENISIIIDKEKERIEKQKEKIEKSFSDLLSKQEEEIKSKEEEIKSLESKKQNIKLPISTVKYIELLQRIEKQANSLVEI